MDLFRNLQNDGNIINPPSTQTTPQINPNPKDTTRVRLTDALNEIKITNMFNELKKTKEIEKRRTPSHKADVKLAKISIGDDKI